jgi:putative transposase
LAVFFNYPPEIGKVIYTTNAIESANNGLRRVIKNRGSFPSDEAALKLIYLALQNLSQKWTMPVKDWRAALNQFAILFEGRLPIR